MVNKFKLKIIFKMDTNNEEDQENSQIVTYSNKKTKNETHKYSKKVKCLLSILVLISLIIFFISYNYEDYYISHRRIIQNKHIYNSCIVCEVKEENKYINEWIDHYKNLEMDKIILLDNNDINGENLTDVLRREDINNNYIDIVDRREIIVDQSLLLNELYRAYSLKCKWIMFFDADEFLHIDNNMSINTFLSNKVFDNFDSIKVNWLMHYADDKLYYENKTVKERFPNVHYDSKANGITKLIFRSGLGDVFKFRSGPHHPAFPMRVCNAKGEKVKRTESYHPYLYSPAYLDHYCHKSTEEYIKKILRNNKYRGICLKNVLRSYFSNSKYTKEKEELILKLINGTGIVKKKCNDATRIISILIISALIFFILFIIILKLISYMQKRISDRFTDRV